MPIEFLCPTCQSTLRVGDESAGRAIRCGGCMSVVTVPGAAPERPSDPSADPVPTSAGRGRGRPDDFDPPARRPDPDGYDDRPRRDRDGNDDRDEYDRPRRRRRREYGPPPPEGRGPLFWAGLLAALFVLGSCLCCGGVYLALPGPNWQRHQSPKGGFAVDLPAPARTDLGQMAGGPPTPGMTVEGTILLRKAEEYVVVWGDVPPQNRFGVTDEQRLDEAVNGFKTSGDVRDVVSQKDITVGGFPGREVECRAKGGGWYTARVIAADTRVYVLVAGGRFAKPGGENVRRFLDSFEITDPQLKAAGQRRADAKKRGDNPDNPWREGRKGAGKGPPVEKGEPNPADEEARRAWERKEQEERERRKEQEDRERAQKEREQKERDSKPKDAPDDGELVPAPRPAAPGNLAPAPRPVP